MSLIRIETETQHSAVDRALNTRRQAIDLIDYPSYEKLPKAVRKSNENVFLDSFEKLTVDRVKGEARKSIKRRREIVLFETVRIPLPPARFKLTGLKHPHAH